MTEAHGPETSAQPPTTRAARAAIGLGAASVLLLLLAVAMHVRARRLAHELDDSRTELAMLSARVAELDAALAAERSPTRPPPAKPDAGPPEHEVVAGGLPPPPEREPRGLEGLAADMRAMAGDFRGGPGVAGAEGEAIRERLLPEAEEHAARVFEGMAEGVELWREYRRGGIEDKDFERRRRKLRDTIRGAVGSFYAVFWRDRHMVVPRDGGVKDKAGAEVF